MTERDQTSHPLVAAYLRDLELLLHGLPPSERGEVLLGVRDHFDEALDANPTEAQVRSVLAELGPAVNIADEAYAAERAPNRTQVLVQQPSWTSSRAGAWVVAALNGMVLAVLALLSAGPGFHPSEILFLFFMPNIWLWLASSIVVLVSRLWAGSEKATLIALTPAVHVAMSILGWTYIALNDYVAMLITILTLGVAAWLLVRLVRSGLRKVTTG